MQVQRIFEDSWWMIQVCGSGAYPTLSPDPILSHADAGKVALSQALASSFLGG
jgi:hypothetical protein